MINVLVPFEKNRLQLFKTWLALSIEEIAQVHVGAGLAQG